MIASPEIRTLTVGDLPEVARVHLAAFPGRALSRLGKPTLLRYYDWQLTGQPDAHGRGAFSKGVLVGFCFSGVFRGSYAGFVSRNRAHLVAQTLTHPWFLLDDLFRDRVRTGARQLRWLLSQRGTTPTSPAPPPVSPSPRFGVLALAVDPMTRKLGIGRRLMDDAEALALRRSFERMNLSVATDNETAIAFYERLGWQRVPLTGEWLGRMEKAIGQHEQECAP